MSNPPRMGNNIISLFFSIKNSLEIFFYCLINFPALFRGPVRQVFFKQVYFSGVEALGLITILGSLVGLAIVALMVDRVGNAPFFIGETLAWVAVQELGPLISAMIVITRSCSATASELASMKVKGEITDLINMGIDPYIYLVIPRVYGISVSSLLLCFYFFLCAVFGGIIFANIFADLVFLRCMEGVIFSLSHYTISMALLKGIVFGVTISSLSCYYGINAGNSITEIPKATTLAVTQSLCLVFIYNLVITLLSV